jgi:hypothetical protein
MLPNNAIDARRLGEQYFFTGRPCIRGHIDKRRTDNQVCVQCNKERARLWAAKNAATYPRISIAFQVAFQVTRKGTIKCIKILPLPQ